MNSGKPRARFRDISYPDDCDRQGRQTSPLGRSALSRFRDTLEGMESAVLKHDSHLSGDVPDGA